ncbi:MAG: sialate O-acetylesterase [Acidobacteria bacterium]|nr:sialate O-acetylesterase [Acidobacteriota bacterium]
MKQKSVFAILFLLAAALTTAAEVRFARIFADHAVLQRQKNIPVWGFAAPNERVSVAFNGQTQSANADAAGRWSVVFAPIEAGGPFELKASAASGEAVVKDVLVGEVWLCSGQSNMEWTVKQADNFAAERKNADYPEIRHFFVEHRVEPDPQSDLRGGEWRPANASTVGDFSAIGFFFAREVYQKLKIPVGIVHSSWGGSQIEGWLSREGMLGSDELRDYALNLPKDWPAADAFLERHVKKATLGDENRNPTPEDEKKYTENGYDFSKWLRGGPVGQWDWQGIWAWRGNGFMARRVDVPAGFVGRETVLGLAESYSYNEIYVNGTRVFAGITKGKRAIIVPRNTWRAGDNSLVVKMNRAIEPEWYGLGFSGSPDDVYLAAGDERIPLAADSWYLMPAFAEKHEFAHSSNNVGTFIYNGMIAPLVPYAVRGVLWYQGETNAGRAYQYRRTFPLLIDDWRKKWGDDFFFFFVQLSSYGANRSANDGSGWAELREAQTMTLKIPKTAMAVTTDVGNPNDIHPTDKQTVGRRLAAAALDNVYGVKMPFSGPLYDNVRFENGRAVVGFRNADGGLTVRDKFSYVRGFEIAGADRKFFYARAEISGNTVVVSSPDVKNPVAVRYAWADAPVDANLFNGAGFPASSFRTDDWPPVTLGGRFW